MTKTPPGAVFDCTVFLQALANRKGPAFACKKLVDSDPVILFLSEEVLAEVTEVLNRPEIHKKRTTITPERVAQFLANVTAKATTPATHLVAWDKDLLDLMDEGKPDGKDFRKRFPGLTLLTPVLFLQEMTAKKPLQRTGARDDKAG